MYYLGIDLGSSSIKLALVDSADGQSKAVVQVPDYEMGMHAPQSGWAEQNPEDWWSLVCEGVPKVCAAAKISSQQISGIGIAYQMHGLVIVDENGKSLRNSIIWCDSRAVDIGEEAYDELGKQYCDGNLLNAPGNFTASKLAWVKANEPDVYQRIHKVMLPGDYIAFRFSGSINTTVSGLSEGIFWDFKNNGLAHPLLQHYGIEAQLIPDTVETFGEQAKVSEKAFRECGIPKDTPINYRAGDQPNNALSLNVFNVGEVAATGGTSGVMYAVTDDLSVKECARVNNFAHVNHLEHDNRIGKLLCINGAGIQYRWLLNNLAVSDYGEMNDLANSVEVGADGVTILPFGNGAERMLLNKVVGTQICNIDLNRHTKSHLCRAALEGIAFSFVYGFEIMQSDGVRPKAIRAGDDNLFRSQIFGDTIATLIGIPIEIYHTTGAIGAARACTITENGFESFSSFCSNDYVMTFVPKKDIGAYQRAYNSWKKQLQNII